MEKKVCLGLQALAEKMPVWAPSLPHYELFAQKARESVPGLSLTLIKSDLSLSPEEELLSWLSTIDLLHGEDSGIPQEELHIYGAAVTYEITEALKAYGVDRITPTELRFSSIESCVGNLTSVVHPIFRLFNRYRSAAGKVVNHQ